MISSTGVINRGPCWRGPRRLKIQLSVPAGNRRRNIARKDRPFANFCSLISQPQRLHRSQLGHIPICSDTQIPIHMCVVSFFGSRGPTVDGRPKPDLVARGEQNLSCRTGGATPGTTTGELYLRMSGTSTAASPVSGIVACFLSARGEFIGSPDQVKHHLLAHCSDLSRDPMHQGSGMPNLTKMLLNT